ncbi:transposon TX1 [Tanacetum coccineum]
METMERQYHVRRGAKGGRTNQWIRNDARQFINNNNITSFLFFNFPLAWEVKNMWEVFRKYGNLVEIYMANKRMRNGQRFGFLRYKDVKDQDRMVTLINDTWVGYFKVRGFLANGSNQGHNKVAPRQHPFGPTVGYANQRFEGRDNRSYREVANGHKEGHNSDPAKRAVTRPSFITPVNGADVDRNIEFKVSGDVEQYLNECLIGTAKEVEILESLDDICYLEGLEDFETRLLGGLDILIKCNSPKMIENIIEDKDHRLYQWVDNLHKWGPEWDKRFRLCWINIEGENSNNGDEYLGEGEQGQKEEYKNPGRVEDSLLSACWIDLLNRS